MLEARNIACQKGQSDLFHGISLRVEPGNVLLVRGANGSGKTSLLRILAGLSSPREGEVLWCGTRVDPWALALRKRTLYLGHTAPLKDDLTVMENLVYALRLDAREVNQNRCLEALQDVGLGARRHLLAKQLSQGQRRRIGIARMLLASRALWLLDEPATALDAEGDKLFKSVLREHLSRRGLAVVSTHQTLEIWPSAQELTLL